MLWQRVLTALVLIPLVVAGILYLDTRQLSIVIAGVILVGANEMGRLAQLGRPPARIAFVAGVAAALWLAGRYLQPDHVSSVQWVMTAWWMMVTIVLVARRSELPRVEGRRPAIMLLGGLVLVTAWISIVALHGAGPHGPALVLFLFILIWVADSGAYFAGRAFGERKLSPYVSPGKTWAGAAGAVAGAVVSAIVVSLTGAVGAPPLSGLVLLCVLVTAVSIGGDLWESRLKRHCPRRKLRPRYDPHQ